jgi:hypothetical protein
VDLLHFCDAIIKRGRVKEKSRERKVGLGRGDQKRRIEPPLSLGRKQNLVFTEPKFFFFFQRGFHVSRHFYYHFPTNLYGAHLFLDVKAALAAFEPRGENHFSPANKFKTD